MARAASYQAREVGRTQIELIGKTWHVRYTGDNGARVRRSLRVGNRAVAERKAREISDLLERGDTPAVASQPTSRGLTVAQLLREFRDGYSPWAASTWRGNESRLQAIETAWGGLPLASLTARQIEVYLARLQDAGRTAATVNRHLAAIKTLLRMAVRWGYLTSSPADRVTMQRELKRPPRGLHDAELAQLLAVLPQPYGDVVAFLADTGMRCSEMEGLTWADVRLAEGFLLCGRKNYEVRTVPLTARARAILQSLPAGSDPAARVWPLTANALRLVLRRSGPAAGLGHVHPHMLRHTFATRLLDHGVPLNDVQALMGHKTPMMTQRYDHVHPERLERAVRALAGE